MIYTFRNECLEFDDIEYDDGLTFFYFNTTGKYGGNENIRNMLKYIENSTKENEVDEATKEVASYVENIKLSPELERNLMTLQDKLDIEKKESYEKGHAVGYDSGALNTTISYYLKNVITKETAMSDTHLSENEFDEAVEKYKRDNKQLED